MFTERTGQRSILRGGVLKEADGRTEEPYERGRREGDKSKDLEREGLFYKQRNTFGITTTPTLQTTLVRARDSTGLVLTTSDGTTVLQSSEN